MAGTRGLEPRIGGLEVRRPIQLDHAPIFLRNRDYKRSKD